MPTVPTYQGPQVQEQAIRVVPQQNIDVSSGTQALAQGFGNAAESFDRIALRDDQAAADQADAFVTTEWLKWDADARKKFRGQNVGGYEPAAQEWWKKTADAVGKDLSVRAKSLASRNLTHKQTQALGSVIQFTGQEKERHADESAAASINSTIQFGVTTGDVASAATQVRGAVAAIGARKGWTTEQVEAESLKSLSALHLAQITKLAEGDAATARAYYDANKAEIGFGQQARVEEVLKAESDNQFATKFAADQASKPLEEQIKAAGEITDPKRREKTLTQIRNNYTLVKEAQNAKEQEFSDKAWQLVGQGQRVPEAILIGMDGKARVQLQDHLRQRAEHAADRAKAGAAAKAAKTDPVTHAKLLDMARDDPDAFRRVPMVSMVDKLSASDMEQMSRIQRDLSKPDAAKDVATTTQIMSTYTGGWKAEKKSEFQSAYLDELNQFEKSKGKAATYEEKRKIGDRLILDGEVLSGSMFLPDPNKKFYQATPEERSRFAPDIASSDRKMVRAALEAEGVKNPTEAQVIERFKLAKGIK